MILSIPSELNVKNYMVIIFSPLIHLVIKQLLGAYKILLKIKKDWPAKVFSTQSLNSLNIKGNGFHCHFCGVVRVRHHGGASEYARSMARRRATAKWEWETGINVTTKILFHEDRLREGICMELGSQMDTYNYQFPSNCHINSAMSKTQF